MHITEEPRKFERQMRECAGAVFERMIHAYLTEAGSLAKTNDFACFGNP